jgi:acetate---CoA ligase (ADP-forming)
VISPADLPANYPAHRAVFVSLRDGSTIALRPVLPSDVGGVAHMFSRLSDESSRMRFHGGRRAVDSDVKQFVEVDYRDRFGLVAETAIGGDFRVVALGSYVAMSEGRAEVALAVDDPMQGKGLGSIILEHLAEAAAEAGISMFVAEVLGGNRDMLEVINALQLPVERSVSLGVVHAEFPTDLTPEAIEAFERREAVASASAVRRFLEPRSVAVVGASRTRGTIGGELFRNLLDSGFQGPVYPVNPKADVVQSVRAYPTVTDIPDEIDLAVIAVPASMVATVAEDCAKKGVDALLVISAGFAEIGEEGRTRQEELLRVARRHGMRIVGPNCMGVLNTNGAVQLNATFSPVAPPPGRLAFSSQSGALGIAVMHRARELGLGMSSFVSVGNKADISGNDLLQYWEQDANTDVILLYLESFGNPRKFARVARRVAAQKPIVAVKSGRSQAGARAAASHTGSLVAGDIAVGALFEQAGVIRTETLEELFDVASVAAYQPLPRGNRVAILTNAGGLGILCADACEASGLEIPELAAATKQKIGALLPPEASVANPVDMIASATAEQYGEVLGLIADDPGVDSVVVIFVPPLVTRAEDVARNIVETTARLTDKTIVSCFIGAQGIHEWLRRGDVTVPTFAFPESAARALSNVTRYASWRAAPTGEIPTLPDVDVLGAREFIATQLQQGERWLEPTAVTKVLGYYGIRSARARLVETPSQVAKAAAEFGVPVAVKIDSRTIVHKTDVGGVRLGLQTPDEAAAAAQEILTGLETRGLGNELDGFLVQEMADRDGVEMFVGVTLDPLFGPLIACGAGGVLVELIRDVSVRITPLTDLDAKQMLRALKTWPLFEGHRGNPPLDASALEDLLLRISAMVEDLPHIAELDLNPVLVSEAGSGCLVLDARVRVARPAPAKPRGSRTT